MAKAYGVTPWVLWTGRTDRTASALAFDFQVLVEGTRAEEAAIKRASRKGGR